MEIMFFLPRVTARRRFTDFNEQVGTEGSSPMLASAEKHRRIFTGRHSKMTLET